MQVETLQDLLEWTRQTHKYMSDCLRECSGQQQEQRTKWLLQYLADHEKVLAKTLAFFEEQGDPKALHTWVYDYLGHTPVEPHRICKAPYAKMTFDEISASVFDVHNQVIDLYRYLQGRADIPEASALVDELLSMEEHETMLLAQQANRIRDL